ncbi:uncharacterized protein LOC143912184 isoform X2 [Arctopsyche grandis]
MSGVCQGFVQNAWKKDLCSNCFKSKDEHTENTTQKNGYFSSPFQNKTNFLSKSLKSSSSPGGILKITSKKKNKRGVSFSQDVCQVIGYGGDIWSDDDEFELSEDTEDDDFIPDCDEEKELKTITKSNTDFNSVKANLLLSNVNGEVKKSYTSLLLGKMQTDSDGKKKTLLVSVTPFGHENTVKSNISKLNDKKPSPIPSLHKNKENKSSKDYKTNIILKSFVQTCEPSITNNCRKDSEPDILLTEKSLLEEISETLENNRINYGNNKTPENGDIKKNSEIFSSNNNKIEENTNPQKTFEKIDIFEYKKNSINRNAPIRKDSEKPKVNVLAKPEFTFCKIDIEPVKHSSNNERDHEVVTKDYSVDTIAKSITSDEDSFSSKSDSDSDERQFIDHTKKNDDCLKILVYSENKDSDSDDKTSSDISLDDIRKVDGQSDSLQDTYESHFQPQILDLPPIIPKIDQTIFSADASRELAGEPDGRADPEEMSEPPALPRSPPPQIDPRPSFLHGMIKEPNMCRPIVPEKPKLPVKPLSVMKQKRPQANVLPQQQVILQLQQTLSNSNSKINTLDCLSSKEEINNAKNTEVVEANNCSIYEDNESDSSKLVKQEINLTPNKRKAPKPPPSTVIEECSGNLYQRNPTANVKSDSPVVREKEKRERASSCSPKFRQNINPNPCGEVQVVEKIPEPAPRRSLSLSHDNLIGDDKKKGKLKFSLRKLLRLGSSKELDKKDLNIEFDHKTISKKDEFSESTPRPKPRLVIIHPQELNGSSVEVVRNNADIINISKHINNDNLSISDGSTYSCSSVGDNEDSGYRDVHNKPLPPPRKVSDEDVHTVDGCPTKPARPPPPKSAVLLRQQKQPAWTTPPPRPVDNVYANLGEVRSAIAPRKPERTASMREREAQLELPKKRMPSSDDSETDIDNDSTKTDALNISISDQQNHNYDDVYGSDKYEKASDTSKHNRNGSDSDYEFVSNCTSIPNNTDRKLYPVNRLNGTKSSIKTSTPSSYRKSDCNMDKSNDYLKMNGNFVRSTSLPYCGSETESEIYSPYSFYSCNEITNEDNNGDFNNHSSVNNTTSKLRVRKGRSVVHKNLEDNYGAVVIANHEALAQVLEQVQQSAMMQPSLRGLKTCTNLRWNDFTVTSAISKGSGSLKIGKRIFHSAVWNSSPAGGAVNVTLMLLKEHMASQLVSQHTVQPQNLSLNAVTEFCDLVPLQQFGEEGDQLVQATVVVLAHSQMDTIETYGEYLRNNNQLSPMNTLKRNSSIEKESSHESQHEATFIMLQLINGLKCLQARGTEELPSSLSTFAISRDSQYLSKNQQNSSSMSETNLEDGPPSIQMPKANSYGRLCIVDGLSDVSRSSIAVEEKTSSLCECAINALKLLLPDNKLTPLIEDLLSKEKAISLNQVKSILEFTLWGPWDVVLGVPIKERELSLQRWLDLERATVLHGLVRTRVHLNPFEQSHLMFLVRSTSKMMCDASVLLESSKIY